MRSCFALVMIVLLFSCKGREQADQPTADTTTPTRYFDLPGAVRTELAEIKRVPRLMYMIREEGGKRDSAVIDTGRLEQLSAVFLEPDLNQAPVKSKYKESVFEDNDTRSIVLNYQTTEAELPAKNISIMLDNETQELKRIDILKSYSRKDSVYDERLAWSSGKGFQLLQLVQAGGKELTRKTNVNWSLSQ